MDVRFEAGEVEEATGRNGWRNAALLKPTACGGRSLCVCVLASTWPVYMNTPVKTFCLKNRCN